MRIALFNIDSLASNEFIRAFIDAYKHEIVLVALSPPIRGKRENLLAESWRQLSRSGLPFARLLWLNFMLPRFIGRFVPLRWTLEGRCRDLGIPVLRLDSVNDPEVLTTLDRLQVDLIVSSFFDQFFKPAILAVPRCGAVNVHISPLPLHRGPMPVIFGCLDDPPRLGVTVHAIDESIDTGPIIAQVDHQGTRADSVLTTMRLLQGKGMEEVKRLLPDLASGTATGTTQRGGSYETFPDKMCIARLHAKGYRLVSIKDWWRAMSTPMSF